jgi:hypothetical protein
MMLLAPVTNWEPSGLTLAGYCYAMRRGMRVQIVTTYRGSNMQRYGVTVRGNVTGVYPPKYVCAASTRMQHKYSVTTTSTSKYTMIELNVLLTVHHSILVY